MMISTAVREIEDDDELLQYIYEEFQVEERREEVMRQDSYTEAEDDGMLSWPDNGKGTVLHISLILKKSEAVVLKLIEIGGLELVMELDSYGNTSLHRALRYYASKEVLLKLIEIGGKDLIIKKDCDRLSTLHCACRYDAPIEVVSKLVEIGGNETVMEKDNYEYTALHHACNGCGVPSLVTVSKLTQVGGRQLVMQKNLIGSTALHFACYNRASIEVVSKLIEIGGRDLVMEKDCDGVNALHHGCRTGSAFEVVAKLIESGGKELLVERNTFGHSALYYGYFLHESHVEDFMNPRPYDDCFIHMVQQGILLQVGGEFGIGGVFNCVDSNDRQTRIFDEWENIAPFLQIAIDTIQHQYQLQLPILHASILALAPRRIIVDILNRFECVLTKDSLNRYPINLAIEKELLWHNGMEEVFYATSSTLQRPIITLAAQYGLKWNNYMSELVELTTTLVMNEPDYETGLYLFMIAAMGDSCDLSSIYGLRRINPEF